MKPILKLVCLLFISVSSFGQQGFVQVDGSALRDADGRMILLRGLNYVNKDKANKFLNLTKDEAFRKMKSWGYNAVRLGVNWSALEPEPGKYNQTYLKDLDQRLQYAKQHGIYVILDMHQDLYGEKFGGGAPLWATLDEGKPHITGGIWSDAYYISPAVQTAFDNFWKNKPTADGVGVQDHYAVTWTMLAERYKEDKNIVGFDVMNEPFIGSPVEQVLGTMMTEITEALNQQSSSKKLTVEEVGAMWMDEKGKNFILQNLTEEKVFINVLKKMEPIYRHFEETALIPFYTRLAKAVRKVNTRHILFWEPSVSSNNGIPTYITPIKEAGTQQGYMPHFYDIVLDTEMAGKADNNRLLYMFYQLARSAEKLQLPMLIGEWGAFYTGGQEVMDAASMMVKGIDSLVIGDFYWDYFRGIENQIFFKRVLLRPYMQAATGKMIQQVVNKNSFTISWQDSKKSKSKNIVFLPNTKNLRIEGKAQYKKIKLNETGSCLLEISSSGKTIKRRLKIFWEE